MQNSSPGKINVLDILAFLVRWRRVWLPATLICAVALGVYSLLATPKYRSFAIVKGVEPQSSGLGSILASKLSGLGNIGGFSASMGEVRGDFYLLILRGRALSEKVINEFSLRELWEMDKAPIEDVIETLNSTTYFKYETGTATVHLSVDDKDAARAKSICEFYIKELDARNQEMELARANKEREFLATRLADSRATLYALEDSMAEFQKASGIFNLEEQAKATVQAVAAIQAQRTLAMAEYEIKSKLYESDNPELYLAKLRLSSIDSSLSAMANRSGAEADFMLQLDRASDDGKTFLRLYRDIEINSLLSAVLTQQYEQARLAEARNTPTLLVVEPPSVGTKRVFPKRGMLVGIGAIIGFALSLLVAGFLDFVRKISDPSHPAHPSFERLRQSRRA